MCGMPTRSRTMRTGAAMPGTSRVPSTSAASGGGGGTRLHAASDSATSISTKASRDAPLQGVRPLQAGIPPLRPRHRTLSTMTIKDALLTDYDHEMGTTRRLLERVPDDKLSWKPHAKSMSLGALATHLAGIPRWAATILNEPAFDLAAAPQPPADERSRAEILDMFDSIARQTRAWMDKTDIEYESLWTLKFGGQQISTVPRVAAFRSFV